MARNSFFQELKRRNVFKVASIYAVTAWLIMQVAAVAFPAFELPIWTQRLVIILAIIGFPIALILAWAQESTAEEESETVIDDSQTSSKKSPWVIPIVVGIIGLAAIGLSFLNFSDGEQEDFLGSQIREERVAALPFSNRTGQENLDDFGYLASDLIINGLTEAAVKTCSPLTVQQYKHLMGVVPNNPEGKASFSEVTGARYWIEGYFMMEGDSLTIKSRLTDGWSGDVVRNFPDVKGHKDAKERLADRLCRRIMGFWVAREDIEKGKFTPPLYEAYQDYAKIYQAEGSIYGIGGPIVQYGRRAFELDSTFYLAALQEMIILSFGQDPRVDTLITILTPHYGNMTSYEQTLFNVAKASFHKDWNAYGQFLEESLELFPKDPFTVQHYSFNLSYRENRPAKAWEIANRIDPHQLQIALDDKLIRISYMAGYGISAGRYKEVIELANTYPRTEKWLGSYFSVKSTAFARSGRLDSLNNLSKEVQMAGKTRHWFTIDYDLVTFCNETAQEILVLQQPLEAKKWLNKAVEWVGEHPERLSTLIDSLHLANTYYLLGEYQLAVQLGRPISLPVNRGKFNWGKHLSILGASYARLGERENAEEVIRQFREYANSNFSNYYAARVCAELGEKEQAMEFLLQRKAVSGWTYHPSQGQHDYFMRNLFGYAPFEELVGIRDERFKD